MCSQNILSICTTHGFCQGLQHRSASPVESVCDHQCVRVSPGWCVSSSAGWSPPPGGLAVSQPVTQWSFRGSGSSPWRHCTSSLWKAGAQWRSARSPLGLIEQSADEIRKKERERELVGGMEGSYFFINEWLVLSITLVQLEQDNFFTYFNRFHSLLKILPLFNSLVNPLLWFVQCGT